MDLGDTAVNELWTVIVTKVDDAQLLQKNRPGNGHRSPRDENVSAVQQPVVHQSHQCISVTSVCVKKLSKVSACVLVGGLPAGCIVVLFEEER